MAAVQQQKVKANSNRTSRIFFPVLITVKVKLRRSPIKTVGVCTSKLFSCKSWLDAVPKMASTSEWPDFSKVLHACLSNLSVAVFSEILFYKLNYQIRMIFEKSLRCWPLICLHKVNHQNQGLKNG